MADKQSQSTQLGNIQSSNINNAPWPLQNEAVDVSEYVSQIHTPQGYIQMHANDNAITRIGFADTSVSEKLNLISELAKRQMLAYLMGNLKHFNLPLAPKGTGFQQSVWQQLLKISHGQTASYSQIATAINNPKASRAVGAANGKNPIAIVIPCHRIIGANGSLTGYAGGLPRKSFLLSVER